MKPPKKSALDMIASAAAETTPLRDGEATQATVKRPNATKAGTKQLTLYLADRTYRQLREVAFTEETKMHPLILEALDMLFASRGRPAIARSEADKRNSP